MKTRSRHFLGAIFVAIFLSVPNQSSAINVWNGFAGDNSWFTAGNWYNPSDFSGVVIVNSLGVQISGTDLGTASAQSFRLGGMAEGSPGTGSVSITNGATLNTEYAYLGTLNTSLGTISISGSGSLWASSNSIGVGVGGGTGIVTITDGASFNGSTYATVGSGVGSTGTVTVNGSGSEWRGNYLVNIGMHGGTGTMTIENGATLTSPYVWLGQEGGKGTLNLGSGGAAGTLVTTEIYSADGKVNLNHNEAAYTLAAKLDGTLSLEQKGSGKTILTRANTYSGGTTVSHGTLLVNNTSGSGLGVGDVEVSAGARLGGSGSYSGSATIDGIYSPGNSVGNLTSGDLAFSSNSVYEWEINNATGTAGAPGGGWDLATVNGDLDFASESTLRIVSLRPDGLAGLAANFDTSAEYTWLIASVTGEITGWETVSIDLSYFANAYSGNFYLTMDEGDLSLVYAVIPEPTTSSLLLGAATTMIGSLIWRRRTGFI